MKLINCSSYVMIFFLISS